MRKSILSSLFAVFVAVALDAHAASITIDGATGTEGANSVDGTGFLPAAESGGDGADAVALAVAPEAVNTADANGGAGGEGGNGGNSTGYPPPPEVPQSFGGSGGAGGAGGDAVANATASGANEYVNARADANGGMGGAGGNPGTGLDAWGLDGTGGSGGDAEAHSVATHSGTASGGASATSQALGGSGNTSGIIGGEHADRLEPYLTQPGGAAGDALATAIATSSNEFASANASAYGGTPGVGGTPFGSSSDWLDGGRAEAHATAFSDGSAEAFAQAVGGQAARSQTGAPATGAGGEAFATAEATSTVLDALAHALQFGGDGAPSAQGARVSSPLQPGGPGANVQMVDAVTGGSPTALTLIQEANGGDGGVGGAGGAALSHLLLAQNTLGGALTATAFASGGYGRGAPYPHYFEALGGAADAIVVATDTQGARVEATALSSGGGGAVSYFGSAALGGAADSSATARGAGAVSAAANAATLSALHSTAYSAAETVGAITRASSGVDLVATNPLAGPAVGPYWSRSANSRSTIGWDQTSGGQAVPEVGQSQAQIFAAPEAEDVAEWTAGSANVANAIVGADVLALGGVGSSSQANDDGRVSGALELDLDGDYFDGSTQLSLAFMQPQTLGTELDVLHLRFSIDGVDVFDESFEDTAAAMLGLDDAIVALGALGGSGDSEIQLALYYELEFLQAAEDRAFAFSFALLSKTPVPEPALAVLLACAVAALYFLRCRTIAMAVGSREVLPAA